MKYWVPQKLPQINTVLLTSVLGRLCDLQYRFAVISEAPSKLINRALNKYRIKNVYETYILYFIHTIFLKIACTDLNYLWTDKLTDILLEGLPD